MSARNPEFRPTVPFRYVLDQLERRYGQQPGSAATWDPEALLRALSYHQIEADPERREKGTVRGNR